MPAIVTTFRSTLVQFLPWVLQQSQVRRGGCGSKKIEPLPYCRRRGGSKAEVSKNAFLKISDVEPPRCGNKEVVSIFLLPQLPLLTQEGTPASATSLQPETPNTNSLDRADDRKFR